MLNPFLPPQGEPSGWPEDPRQWARLAGAQVRELVHSELPRDAHGQEQVRLAARRTKAWEWRAHASHSLGLEGLGRLGILLVPPVTLTFQALACGVSCVCHFRIAE